MTREQFFEDLAKKARLVLTTLEEKNAGYNPTTDDPEYEPLYNYDLSAEIAGIYPEQSLIARMGEKLIRVRNLVKSPNAAGQEAITDSCKDLVGHALLLWYSAERLEADAKNWTEEGEYIDAPRTRPRTPATC